MTSGQRGAATAGATPLGSGAVMIGTGPLTERHHRRTPGGERDRRLLVAVARIRVLLATGTAAILSLSSQHGTPEGKRAILLAGLVWTPWAIVAVLLDRPTSTRARLVTGLGDVATVLATVAIAPRFTGAGALAAVLLVGVGTYISGRIAGLCAGAILLVGLVGLSFRNGVGPMEGTLDVALGPVLLLVNALVDWVVAEQHRQAARVRELHGKSEAILAHVGSAVVVTDESGAIRQWNPACERAFGIAGDAVQDQACHDVLSLRMGERRLDCSSGCALLALCEAAAAAPADDAGADEGIQLWRQHHDGRRQPLLANASAVRDEAGHVVEIVHTLKDITALKQADEAKTLFLATASHELKTPLTVIRGFAQTLVMAPDMDPASRSDALHAIQRRAVELSRIVDRLLLSSRIEAGRISILGGPVDLGPILRDRTSGVADSSGRSVALDIPPVLDDAWAEVEAITTVIDHLLDNAVKYSPGGETVRVTADVDDAAGSVWFAITDAGIGMTDEQAAHCFDKFWQAESSDIRRFGGTGIGLYIVKSLVDAMGGDVEVRSAPGKGTTFRVTLATAVAATRAMHEANAAATEDRAAAEGSGEGEPTIIREFMRQLGVPTKRVP